MAHPPQQVTRKYGSYKMMFLPSFLKIYHCVPVLSGGDRQTAAYFYWPIWRNETRNGEIPDCHHIWYGWQCWAVCSKEMNELHNKVFPIFWKWNLGRGDCATVIKAIRRWTNRWHVSMETTQQKLLAMRSNTSNSLAQLKSRQILVRRPTWDWL
jgi:hypothetical protein